jgi:predicted enzyme related to lactoylglutathione lyase
MQHKGFIWAGLFVEDMEAAIQFYRDVLGLRLLGKGDSWAHFDAGDHALFEIMGGGSASNRPKEAHQQSLVLGLRVVDLDSAVLELKEKGVEFIGEIGTFKDTRWAHFSDPEGNRLEIKEVPGIR